MLKPVLALVIILHGLIHLLGFVKAFKLAEIEQLSQPISKVAGIFWLLSCLLMLASAILLLLNNGYWGMVAITAIVLSQVLILTCWKDAKAGTVANFLILLGWLFG